LTYLSEKYMLFLPYNILLHVISRLLLSHPNPNPNPT
jgi:hypothetical protein